MHQEILDWLASQDLLLLAFQAGGMELGAPGLLIAPANAAFFAAGLANLHPGPSAKKGIHGALINIGEQEHWTTLHGSTVEVVTPDDNIVTIMHEGASGGEKSEMLEYPHRELDGRLLLGENVVTRERRYLSLTQGCTLHPVTDDMALCHSRLKGDKRTELPKTVPR